MCFHRLCIVLLTCGWWAISPARSAEPAAPEIHRPYEVKFCFLELRDDGKHVVGTPTVTVRNHRRASFYVGPERPFVVAVSPAGEGGLEPIVETVREGRRIDFACHTTVNGQVTLDLNIEETKVVEVIVKELDDKTSIQQPQVKINKVRRFVTGPVGDTLIVPLDDQPAARSKYWAEIVIEKLEPR
jgi:hypothetical protein